MKINKLYILFLLLATTFMGACSEYEDTVEPSPVVSADNPSARFLSTNKKSLELQVSDNFTFALEVARDNGKNAAEIPVTVVENGSDVFVVPQVVSFAAGEVTTNLIVKIKETADKGVDYGLELKFDEQYTNPYKSDLPIYKGKIAISAWDVFEDKAQFYDSFAFYQVAEVTFWQSTIDPNMYRISFPYLKDILEDAEWEEWIGGEVQEHIVFTVKGENVVWDKFWHTNLIYQGGEGDFVKAYLPSGLSEKEKDSDAASVVVKDEEGNIIKFDLYPYIYIDGVGGFGLQEVLLGFPGYDLAGELELPIFGKE